MGTEAIETISAIVAIVVGVPLMAAACVASRRVQDTVFFLMVFGTCLIQLVDINFLSHAWYRGTSRGLQVSAVELLALSLLVSLVVSPKERERRLFWPPSLAFLLVYLAYCGVVVLVSSPRLPGLFELLKFGWALVFFIATAWYLHGKRELRIMLGALIAVVLFEGLVALGQRYGMGVYRVSGTLGHANNLSMYLGMLLPIMVNIPVADVSRKMRYMAMIALFLGVGAVLMTVSRMGILAMALVVGFAGFLSVTRDFSIQKAFTLVGIFLIGCAGVYKAWDTLSKRFARLDLEAEYTGEKETGRGHYLRLGLMMGMEHPFGVGLNNWSYYASRDYYDKIDVPMGEYGELSEPRDPEKVHKYAAPAHNLGALTLGELGWAGLLLLGLCWARWFQMGVGFVWRYRHDPAWQLAAGIFIGLGAVALQSATEWIYRFTNIYMLSHVYAGALAALYVAKNRKRGEVAAAAHRQGAVERRRQVEATAAH